MKVTGKELNALLDVLNEMACDTKTPVFITKELADDWEEEFDCSIENFVGYTIRLKQVGDHRTDGQMVDYTIIFEDYQGKKSKIETSMCLMVGWDFEYDKIYEI